MADSPEEVNAFIRKCIFVFVALMALTVITVAVSYLESSTPFAIFLGLLIALLKGSLVALFFMHLIAEKKIVYYVMALTFSFFALVMYLPSGWDHDLVESDSVWTVLPEEVLGGGHGDDHGDDDGHGHDHGDEGHEAH
jgi:cytochrome c oxidase subunit 4